MKWNKPCSGVSALCGWAALCIFMSGTVRCQGVSSAASPAPPQPKTNAEFMQAADDVLGQMSKILDLPVKQPLRKSLKSKEQIRAYLVRHEEEDETPEKRYADQKSLEAFGLIPKGFPLDSFMLDVLTDEVAGLYDPDSKEFFIADWIPVDEQRMIMAHELTHALDDQYFQIEPWLKAARPNDDAESARDAVLEGSATAAMMDYLLRDQKMSVRDVPDVAVLVQSGALGEIENNPKLKKAPAFLRDDLVFPYITGLEFSQQFLKARSGWGDFKEVFQNPPVSTQQILHPGLYLKGVQPDTVSLPGLEKALAGTWKKLDENVVGEFNLEEILKQQLGAERADSVSAAWKGDRYAVFEDAEKKKVLLVFLLHLDNAGDAARFFAAYGDALEKKHGRKPQGSAKAGPLDFQDGEGEVSLECAAAACLSIEGADRATLNRVRATLGWPAAAPPAAAQ